MWRDHKKTTRPIKKESNRLRLVVAIIFLLTGSLIYRLYYIQIGQGDIYTALAANQHDIYSKLKPERGKIVISDNAGGESKEYVLATNKDFYLIFAVPIDIAKPQETAELLFNYFNKAEIEKEVTNNFEKIDQANFAKSLSDVDNDANLSAAEKELKIKELSANQKAFMASSNYQELLKIKKDQEVFNKRAELLLAYEEKLSRPNSQYAVIKNKVSDDDLLKFYAYLNNADPARPVLNPEKMAVELGKIIDKERNTEVKIPGFSFETRKFRYYPEENIASHVLGFVSYSNEDGSGHYGLEEFFNEELFGQYGSLKGERGVGNSMIVNDMEYVKPVAGSDLMLTIDRSVEFFACDALKKSVIKFDASGGTVIVVNPQTGAILAMCSYPDFDPNNYQNVSDIQVFNNPAVASQYEPGSVFKTITMAAAMDRNKVSPSTTYKDEGQIMINGWPKPIKNADFDTKGGHGIVDMTFVLENSLNTGAIFAMKQIGPKIFSDYVSDFGFGERTGIELGSEATGNINSLLKNKVREIDAATASFGQGISVTPLQMLMSYQALANKGIMMKPYIVSKIINSDGTQKIIQPQILRKVVSEATAAKAMAMLVNVVENGHSKKAAIDGYYVGAKTGTAQIATAGGYEKDRYNHTFIGVAPVDNPRFVMLTNLNSPNMEYAESTVAPLWREIADFMLKYYQVPKTRK